MRIEVEIDELILDDVSPAERLRVARALESELERLLAAGGWSGPPEQGSLDVPFLDGGTIEAGSPQIASAPRNLGGQLARALHAGVTANQPAAREDEP